MQRIFFIVFIGCFTTLLHAQEVRFTTQPAADRVGLQDPFEVQYSIQNADQVHSFSIPNLNDFYVVGGPSKSTRISSTNGHRSSSVDIIYVLRAKRKGRLIIPGGIAEIDHGRQIRSNAVAIEVIDGTVARRQAPQTQRNPDPLADFFDDPFGDDVMQDLARQQEEIQEQIRRMQQQMSRAMQEMEDPRSAIPQRIDKAHLDDNIFIKVDVDKTKVNLGEQITASYKLYTRVPVHMNITKLPALVGFWSQDFEIPQPPPPRNEIVNGMMFNVYELKRTALFPTRVGDLELDAAEAQSIEIFDNKPLTVRSNPLRIQVVELPMALKPGNFKGAVGQFTMDCDIDKTELTTDDVATITVRISGTGNLKLIEAPHLKFPSSIDLLDVKEFDTVTNTNNVIAGYKTFIYSFAPKTTGTFTIPAPEFSYFDTKENMYRVMDGQSYVVHVTPGTNKESAANKQVLRDIHDIETKNVSIRKNTSGLWIEHPLYWTGYGLPMIAYLVLLGYRRKENKILGNAVLLKNKRANKIALQRLSQADEFLKGNSPSQFYEETSKAVWLYLSDKLNIPLSSLSKDVAGIKMQQAAVPSDIQSELFRITNDCEMALYAHDRGSLVQMNQTYNDAFKLIGQLEETLS